MVDDEITSAILGGIDNALGKEIPEEYKKVKESFHEFGSKVMGRQDKHFHTSMRQMLMDEQFALFLFPRGFAKSTIASVEFPCWSLGRNRDLRIVLATNALRLGIEWGRQIESVLGGNTVYREIFGNLIPEARTLTWTDSEKIIAGRSPRATHTSIYCVSSTGSTLGKRADIIICDDIFEPEAGIPTESQIRRVKEWFWKVLFPILEPGGKCFVVGTRFHQLDLYGELISRGWNHIVQPALIYNEESGKEESTWPERISTKELLQRRDSMGSIIFNLQYQNNADVSSRLQLEFLHMVTEEDIPKDLVIYQGVDPSVAAGASSDYFAMATIGVSQKTKKGYLLDLVRARLGYKQQMQVIRETASIWKPRKIGMETNAAQVFLKEGLQEEENPWEDAKSKKKRISTVLNLPIIDVPSRTSKTNRILSMSALFEAGLVSVKAYRDEDGLVPHSPLEPFVAEWLTFPNSKHDDALDAVEKACAVAEFGLPKPYSEIITPDIPYYRKKPRVSVFHNRR